MFRHQNFIFELQSLVPIPKIFFVAFKYFDSYSIKLSDLIIF